MAEPAAGGVEGGGGGGGEAVRGRSAAEAILEAVEQGGDDQLPVSEEVRHRNRLPVPPSSYTQLGELIGKQKNLQ